MARRNAVMSKAKVSEESYATNVRTARSFVGLICSCTKTSKCSAIFQTSKMETYQLPSVCTGPKLRKWKLTIISELRKTSLQSRCLELQLNGAKSQYGCWAASNE